MDREKLKKALNAAVAYVYPPTRKKLHRLFHAALLAVTVGGSAIVWLRGQDWGWSTWTQVEAQLVLVGAFLARAEMVVKRLDAIVDKLPIPEDAEVTGPPAKVVPLGTGRDVKDRGNATEATMFWAMVLGIAFAALTLLFSGSASAECKSPAPLVVQCDRLTLQPSFAAGWQLNLRRALDNGITSSGAYQRFAGLAGYGFAYHGEKVTAGAGLYFGVGLAADQPNAPQLSLIGTLYDRYGLGVGVQRVPWEGGHVFQWLASLVLNYQAGATTTTFLDALKGFARACVGAACGL